jgi:hypothetical protein
MATKTVYEASEGQRFSADTQLNVVECPTCHVTYAIPASFHRAARKYNSAANPSNYWEVCCPFGHSWHYTGLDEEQRLRRRLEASRESAGFHAARADQAEASARGQKAAATRARNERDRILYKVRAGVCPVKGCGRSFKNVRRHIASQHPDFDVPEEG